MKKLSLFMLMAVGLLISASMFAAPERPVPPTEPKAFMMNPVQSSYVQKAPRKALMTGDILETSSLPESVDLTINGITTNYTSLQEAFNALPTDNTPALIVLRSNIYADNYASVNKGSYIELKKHHSVTLDLNGDTIFGVTDLPDVSSQVILNNGKLTIIDSKGDSEMGAIINLNKHADDSSDDPTVKYAYNVITNCGELIINDGFLQNRTQSNNNSGFAAYCVDNNSTSSNPKLIINGGHLYNYYTCAIRQFCNSTKNTNDVIVNGGLIEGYQCIWMQNPNVNANNGTITINGGEFHSLQKNTKDPDVSTSIRLYGRSDSDCSNMYLTINDGVFHEGVKSDNNTSCHIAIYGGNFYCPLNSQGDNIKLYGGYFTMWTQTNTEYGYVTSAEYYMLNYSLEDLNGWGYYTKEQWEEFGYVVKDLCEVWTGNSCGIWWYLFIPEYRFNNFFNNAYGWIADGFCSKYISDNGDGTQTLQIVPKQSGQSQEGTKEDYDDDDKNTTGWHQTTTWTNDTVPSEVTSVTIGDKAKVVVEEGTTASAYGILLADSAKLIVKEGATLIVGAGGIQRLGDSIPGTENADTTTIIVQPGGTMIATNLPDENTGIYVHSDGQNAGVLLFDPSATETQKLAHVDLTTYCRIDENGNNFWQMVAIPVDATEGNYKVTNNGNNGSFTFAEGYSKLGSWLCKWDYENGEWEVLDKTWRNEKANENFIGYDLSNTSSKGGVTYTFEGNLIGNQNVDFVLPKAGYSILGNSYTAPMDVLKLFEQVDNDVNHGDNGQSSIEEVIYVYNSKMGYYECTTRFQQELHQALGNAYPISFTAIAPMQGFLMNLMGASSTSAGISVDYAKAIFGGAHVTKPAYAPKSAATDYILADINVTTTNANDHLMLVEGNEFSSEFENGKDAYKYMNKESMNLYVINNDANYAAFATDNLEGTFIAFQSNDQTEYTISFTNCLNNDYVLVDLENNQSVAMTNGQIYSFTATPNTVNPSRFMITTVAQAPTTMEKVKAVKVNKGIYTVLGHYMGSAENWNNMSAGVYIVNGQTLIK